MKKLTLIAFLITTSFSVMASSQVSLSNSFVLQKICIKSESEGTGYKSESEGTGYKSTHNCVTIFMEK